MTSEFKRKLIRICEEISDDVKKDISDFEGKNVATLFGYQAAAISSLSRILGEVIKSIEDEE